MGAPSCNCVPPEGDDWNVPWPQECDHHRLQREKLERLRADKPTGNGSAAEALVRAGVYANAQGLEGLLNSQEFWDKQTYGTRLYYGDGSLDYLHRDVLRVAVDIIVGMLYIFKPTES